MPTLISAWDEYSMFFYQFSFFKKLAAFLLTSAVNGYIIVLNKEPLFIANLLLAKYTVTW